MNVHIFYLKEQEPRPETKCRIASQTILFYSSYFFVINNMLIIIDNVGRDGSKDSSLKRAKEELIYNNLMEKGDEVGCSGGLNFFWSSKHDSEVSLLPK